MSAKDSTKESSGNALAAWSASFLFEIAAYTVGFLILDGDGFEASLNAAILVAVFVRIWKFFRTLN